MEREMIDLLYKMTEERHERRDPLETAIPADYMNELLLSRIIYNLLCQSLCT